MTKTRFSHAQCEHPSTKAARAKCRKEMRAAATGEVASTPKPVAVTPTKKNPRKAAAPVVAVEPPADASAPAADAEKVETAPAAELTEVTRETWREFKDQRVTVHVVGVEEPFTNLELIGWSIRLIQFKDAEASRTACP